MDIDSDSTAQRVPPLIVVQSEPRYSVPTAHLSHVPITIPGEPIPADSGVVRGHGTQLSIPGQMSTLTATVSGVVEKVNKLVAVRPLRSRYIPEVGDVVIGRVVELAVRRWKIYLNARGDAYLLLSAVNLPGGVQRRRNAEDELNMRSFYTEGDLVSAEVQELRNDGAVALHTRSLRYGKLDKGQLVVVQPSLIKRAKKHFHLLPCGVHAILGNNGYIFLSILETDSSHESEGPESNALHRLDPSHDGRRIIARVRNAIVALDLEFVAISPDTISTVYEASLEYGIRLAEMVRPDVTRKICAGARELRDVA